MLMTKLYYINIPKKSPISSSTEIIIIAVIFKHYIFCWRLFCHVGRFENVKNLSSKSQNCHQQGPSPTSVNNIDVALFVSQKQTASLFEMKMGR